MKQAANSEWRIANSGENLLFTIRYSLLAIRYFPIA